MVHLTAAPEAIQQDILSFFVTIRLKIIQSTPAVSCRVFTFPPPASRYISAIRSTG